MEACVSPAHRRLLPEKWEASPARAGSSHGIDLGGANPARLGQLPPLHEGWVDSDGLGLLRAGRDGEAGEIASLVRGAQEYHWPAFMAGKVRVGKRDQDDIARLKRHSTPRLRRCSSR